MLALSFVGPASLLHTGYILSFYFFLDLAATVSMVMDIKEVRDELFGSDNSSGNLSDNSQMLKAGRTSRAGTSHPSTSPPLYPD